MNVIEDRSKGEAVAGIHWGVIKLYGFGKQTNQDFESPLQFCLTMWPKISYFTSLSLLFLSSVKSERANIIFERLLLEFYVIKLYGAVKLALNIGVTLMQLSSLYHSPYVRLFPMLVLQMWGFPTNSYLFHCAIGETLHTLDMWSK